MTGEYGPRDWAPEDEKTDDDNAHYRHTCVSCSLPFIGHKRRSGGVCKLCFDSPVTTVAVHDSRGGLSTVPEGGLEVSSQNNSTMQDWTDAEDMAKPRRRSGMAALSMLAAVAGMGMNMGMGIPYAPSGKVRWRSRAKTPKEQRRRSKSKAGRKARRRNRK